MARDDAWIAGIDTSVLWSVDRRSAASVMVYDIRKGWKKGVIPAEIEVPHLLPSRLLAFASPAGLPVESN